MWSIFRLLDDNCAINILDIGAAMIGKAPPYQRIVDANRARIVGFEPDPGECERLNEVYGDSHRFIPAFVGNGREATYHQTSWVATGSLFEPNIALLEKFADLADLFTPVSQVRVATTRLDDVADLGDVDFLKIDVQGCELDVFRNATSVLQQVLVIQTEISFVEMYKNMPLFADVDAFLRKSGFRYHRIDGFGARPFKSSPAQLDTLVENQQQLWTDAIYVRDWMQLDVLSSEKLKKYAAMAHDILESYDLAHTVLTEHDRQTGLSLARAYYQQFSQKESRRGDSTPRLDYLHDGELQQRDLTGATRPFPATGSEDALFIETSAGHIFSAPASLNCISSYALLEQERWFEIELDFLGKCLADGMTAVDIGSNIGIYVISMAKAMAPDGHIFAYEPAKGNCHHLERNIDLNRVSNVTLSCRALSSSEGKAFLSIGAPDELDSIIEANADSSTTEPVMLTTLDAEIARNDWKSIDVIKIDAKGQEAQIISGGRRFFRDFSPLVMFKVEHGDSANSGHLRWTFEALGYEAYRLLGDGSMLVPLESGDHLDTFQLNLFAAKPDRARKLAASGLLVMSHCEPRLSDGERALALATMLNQPFARAFEMELEDIAQCPFANALADYSAYRFLEGLAPDKRYALLMSAASQLDDFCQSNTSPAALATLARVAGDLGCRQAANNALSQVAKLSGIEIDYPFFPACSRYDSINPGDTPELWFKAAATEQFELSRAFSSQFRSEASPLKWLKWLCRGTYASAEILRRTILVGMMDGLPRRDVSEYLSLLNKSQILNQAIWQRSADELYSLWGIR